MRLDGTPETEPVIFDVSALPEGTLLDGDLQPAFTIGRAAFDDELQTAVAVNHGINNDGELDMTMLAAAEQAASYLQDKQGQPLLLVDIAREPAVERDLVYITGYIATIDVVPQPVGIDRRSDDRGRFVSAGIAVAKGHTALHGYCDTRSGHYSSQNLNDQKGSLIPFYDGHFRLGSPNNPRADEGIEVVQELVAGQDILPWIQASFTGNNAYEFYMDLVQSVLRHSSEQAPHEALDSLLVEPFVEAARHEQTVLRAISETLKDYEIERGDLLAVMAGVKAATNLKLKELSRQHDTGLSRHTPRTPGSYPLSITGRLDDPSGEQLARRQQAIEWYMASLEPLVTRANQVKSS